MNCASIAGDAKQTGTKSGQSLVDAPRGGRELGPTENAAKMVEDPPPTILAMQAASVPMLYLPTLLPFPSTFQSHSSQTINASWTAMERSPLHRLSAFPQ